MSSQAVHEIAPSIFWVGIENWNRRVSYALIHLPYGDSANSYLVVGKDQTALIDTVYAEFWDQLLKNIEKVRNPEDIDYVVMNHAEPDHAGCIPKILSVAKNAKLVVTRMGFEMAKAFYDVPPERMMAVKEGDTIDLGGKTLRFIEAPWLHWPETMFTYCVEDKVLFSCDFFATHMAKSKLYDDEVGDWLLPEAKAYYGFVLMPFQVSIQRALDKVKNIDFRIIGPSHGPVYRNPKRIVELYEQWARGPLKPKAVILYVSMWGETEILAQSIAESMRAEGIEAIPFNLLVSEVTYILREIVDASATVIGSPTFVNEAHPLVLRTAQIIRAYKPRGKIAGVFGSYGWGRGAVTQITDMLQKSGLEIVETLEVRGKPKKDDLEKAASFGRHVAQRIKESIKA